MYFWQILPESGCNVCSPRQPGVMAVSHAKRLPESGYLAETGPFQNEACRHVALIKKIKRVSSPVDDMRRWALQLASATEQNKQTVDPMLTPCSTQGAHPRLSKEASMTTLHSASFTERSAAGKVPSPIHRGHVTSEIYF